MGDDAAVLDARADGSPDAGRPGGCTTPDVDRDGFPAIECGGSDCDDTDPQRTPGGVEFCDPEDRDEDCDPRTFGIRDLDLDGSPDSRCCNVDGTGTRMCGSDCDDMRPGVSPTATEVCNRIDDDCDLGIDEMVGVVLWPDVDGDGYGDADPGAVSMSGCPGTTGFATSRGDCADTEPGRHLGAPEVCNGIDDDCDDVVDDIVEGMFVCSAGDDEMCTTSLGRLPGSRFCGADCRSWTDCTAPEVCNGFDDDLNGSPDDRFACVLGALTPCRSSCGTDGFQPCEAGCALGICRAPEICNFCDDDLRNGITDENALATASEAALILDRGLGGTPSITTRVAGGASSSIATGDGSGNLDITARLIDGSTRNQVGAYWVDIRRYQGWGPTTLRAEMRVRLLDAGYPMGGWSVIIANGGTGDLGTGMDRGVPTTRTGVRFDWIWGHVYPMDAPNDTDMLAYGTIGTWRGFLSAGGTAVADIGRAVPGTNSLTSGAGTGTVTQTVLIHYRPNEPGTAANEERVVIGFPTGGTPPACNASGGCATLGYECIPQVTSSGDACFPAHVYVADLDGNTADPANDLPVGSLLSIGFTAGTWTYTWRPPGAPSTFTYAARVQADLLVYKHRPAPSGSGALDIEEPHTALRRTRICSGGF